MEGRDQRFRDLLASYARGRISRDEFDELFDRLCREGHASPQDFAAIWDNVDSGQLPIGDKEMLFERIQADSRYKRPASRRRIMPLTRRLAGLAAVLLACLTVGVLVFYSDNWQRAVPAAVETAAQQPLTPGTNKAVLEWSGGGQMELEDTESGIAMANGTIAYEDGTALDERAMQGIRSSEELIVRIPRGGQYRVVMDDGSVVWLNAGSTLRYPSRFTHGAREVVLEGEAFFEITKDAGRPFLVRSGNVMIEVLGTRFNVSAYSDDEALVTTVAEGSVRVSQAGEQVVLVKDQAATAGVTGRNGISVRTVAAERAMAWTSGLFLFDRDNISEVMKRIGRWYDAEIVLQGDFSRRTLGGTVSRYESLEKLLDVLAMTDHFKYKIEGRRVTIME